MCALRAFPPWTWAASARAGAAFFSQGRRALNFRRANYTDLTRVGVVVSRSVHVTSGREWSAGNAKSLEIPSFLEEKKVRPAPGGEPAAREPGRGTGRGDVTGDA
jgi:hypothetical protein